MVTRRSALGAAVTTTVVAKVAFDHFGWKLGAFLLNMKFDGDTKKAGLSYRSVRLPSGEESWFLERAGSSTEPALVLVPGFTTPAEHCSEWVLHLKVPAARRVIILDLPGHGRNRQAASHDVKFTPAEIANWFATILPLLAADSVDIYAFSTGAGAAAAYVNRDKRGASGPTVRHVALLNPFLPETMNDKIVAAGGGKLFGWSKGGEFLDLLSNWLNVSAPMPGFIVQAIEAERAEWPQNYWRDLGDALCSADAPLLEPRSDTQSEPEVVVVWGEKDKVTDVSKSQALLSALPLNTKLVKLANCGHAGVDGSATDNVFTVSADMVSARFFGAASKL